MIVTRELRATVADRFIKEGGPLDQELLDIANRIDAKHEEMREFCERLEGAAKERADITILGVDYTALPVDADGAPIRTDDMMQIKDCDGRWCGPFKVLYQVLTGVEWKIVFDAGTYAPEECRHYRAPTVENVLREFVERWMKATCYQEPELFAEYAAKLRLAGDE